MPVEVTCRHEVGPVGLVCFRPPGGVSWQAADGSADVFDGDGALVGTFFGVVGVRLVGACEDPNEWAVESPASDAAPPRETVGIRYRVEEIEEALRLGLRPDPGMFDELAAEVRRARHVAAAPEPALTPTPGVLEEDELLGVEADERVRRG